MDGQRPKAPTSAASRKWGIFNRPLRANDHETSTPRKFTLEGDR